MLSAEVAIMHNVSVKMNDNDFSLLDGMAKQSRKSRAEIMREALQSKAAYEAYKKQAIQEGIESAEMEPLTSHEDVVKELAEFRVTFKEKHR